LVLLDEFNLSGERHPDINMPVLGRTSTSQVLVHAEVCVVLQLLEYIADVSVVYRMFAFCSTLNTTAISVTVSQVVVGGFSRNAKKQTEPFNAFSTRTTTTSCSTSMPYTTCISYVKRYPITLCAQLAFMPTGRRITCSWLRAYTMSEEASERRPPVKLK
jgi:hypothetical protein